MLGSIILDNSLAEQARRVLPPEWMYTPSHSRIYTAILALHEIDIEITSLSIAEELRRDCSLESCGGVAFISSLYHGLPAVRSLETYIKPIKETARRRQLKKLAAQLEERSEDEGEDLEQTLSGAIDQLDRIRSHTTTKRRAQSLEEIADDQLLRYELFLKGVSDALPTGFNLIDDHLLGGGFVPSALYILAAPTSFGKSTLGLDITANVAETGRRVYVLSREMSRESLFDRLVAYEGSIPRWMLRPGMYEREYRQAVDAVARLSRRPIILDDVSNRLSDVRGYLREYARRDEGVQMLVVDYLQLVDGARKESRVQEVGSVSRGLKGLAMEFRIPVLAISQLSRAHANERREPELRDLRESGEIEQDADAVFFLFGDKPEEHAKFFNRTFKCAKQREGPLFRAELPFDGELITYRKRQEMVYEQRAV